MMDASDISRGVEKIPIPLASTDDLPETSDFVYVLCNIPGPQTPRDKWREQIEGCWCDAVSSCSGSCPCLARDGPSYDDNYKLNQSKIDPYRNNQKPVYECNKTCRCSSECHNRVVQRGVQVKLEAFKTKQKGIGLRTREPVEKYSFVCEYAGEVLTSGDAKQRMRVLTETQSTNYYILAVKEHLGSGKVLVTYVDPMFVGNVGRFINHSCEPNLFMIPVRINNDVPRMGLFALRDIAVDEELTFDYSGVIQDGSGSDTGGDTCGGGGNEDGAAEVNCGTHTPVITFRKRLCHCGAANCRGFLPFDDSLYSD